MAARYQQASLAGLAWILLPLAAYFAVLRTLWFNAPLLDDYYILDQAMRMRETQSAREWLAMLVAQHNEHRVAVLRLAMQIEAWVLGHFDFRLLTFVGNLSMAGLLVLLWLEFRAAVAAPLFAAAGFILLQASYFEASLMPSAAIANLGVVFFGFACIYCAGRPQALMVAASVAFALLAVGSQGNGIFALPIAAALAAVTGLRRRAIVLAAIAVLLAGLYFIGYAHPGQHPSLFASLGVPLMTLQVFLLVLGGVMADRWGPVVLGAIAFAAMALLVRRGALRMHPTAVAWAAFILVSAAAAAAGRASMGFFQASRYGVYSSAWLALVLLLACVLWRRPSPRMSLAVVAAAAMISAAISAAHWSNTRSFSLAGRILLKPVPASLDASSEKYVGIVHSDPAYVTRVLDTAEARGSYLAPRVPVHASGLAASPPANARVAGALEGVRAAGSWVELDGWTDILPTLPGRKFSTTPTEPKPRSIRVTITARPDVAGPHRDPAMILAGFRMGLEYGSPEEALRIAPALCLFAEGPGKAPAALARATGSCAPR